MLTLSLVMIGAAVPLADPYGPPYAVTNMAPFCPTCHASASPAQLQGLPADVAAGETIDGKHLMGAINCSRSAGGGGPCAGAGFIWLQGVPSVVSPAAAPAGGALSAGGVGGGPGLGRRAA